MERLYEAPGLWDAFMRLQWPSFRDRIPENPEIASTGLAVINAGYQMSDVNALTEALGRDLMDGKVDDKPLAKKWVKEAKEAIAALSAAVVKLEKGG